ncbi:DUF805 domain-containing protein [Paenibacillus luteus]|uniref:DUF805 domain-containing protein n=1 Tax=Paenibacillus luteus TaxID=2545753 RepID=UPI001143272F|nr:DUF805 domain-containing protein [Paenibacillus luteus]
MQWYMKAMKNYVNLDGRARRMEFWMFFLMNALITAALLIIESLAGIPGILSGIYYIAVFLPSIAVSVRRLHDIGKSGLWIFIGLVPFIGTIVLLVFSFLEGENINKYGANPKLHG